MEEIPLVKDIFKKCPYFKTFLPSFELDFLNYCFFLYPNYTFIIIFSTLLSF